jgi:hypothetical protein
MERWMKGNRWREMDGDKSMERKINVERWMETNGWREIDGES